MADFNACVAFTLREEGGLVDNPADPGGLTKYGISQRSYPDVDIANLTEDDAAEIYKRDYWSHVNGDALPDGLDLMVFDFAVNAGPSRSIRLLQQAIGVDSDGVMGPVTMATIAALDPRQMISALEEAQSAYYRGLHGYLWFGQGWMARTGRRLQTALIMAAA